MVEYRPVPNADVDAWSRSLAYAFRPAETYEPVDSVEDLPAPATLGDRRGLYEDGELRCTGAHHWFSLRVRGEFEDVPGLSAVSTPPRYRRRGLVRRLLAESLSEYRERGAGFCALWPFSHPFYRKFGWGTCSRRARVTCEPDALAGIGVTTADGRDRDSGLDHDIDSDRGDAGDGRVGDPEYPRDGTKRGAFVTLSADDWEALDRVYRTANSRGLTMDRTEAWWRKRVLQGWDDDPYVAGWERDDRLAGYLVYDVEEGAREDGRRLVVREYGHVDFEAYRAVLEFCRYHDSQVDEIEFTDPVDTTLQDLVRDPREIDIEIEPGPMVRIVDVARALSTLSYPTDAEADLLVDVTDALADWNDGRFHLSVADGIGACEPLDTDASDDADSADLTTPIAPLSQVAIGYLSVERAEQVGRFDVSSIDGRETLEAVFQPEETFLREFF